MFFIGLTILSNFTSINSPCKARPEFVNVNTNNPYFILLVLKQGNNTMVITSNGNNINDPYAKICVPDVIKDFSVKVFSP